MSITANVVDGMLDSKYTQTTKKEQTGSGSNLGYDQFLQLLCAEMQYQDPLQPTSNTDYVAQLATFSQLEATLSSSETQQSAMANTLVGQQVIIKDVDETTSATKYVDGKVDYVLYQDGKIMLSVNDSLYPLSSLDTVADSDYYEAVSLGKTFSNMILSLPDANNVTLSDKSTVESVREIYDGMTDYQKKYVNTSDFSRFIAIETKVQELQNAANGNADSSKPVIEEI